MGDARVHISQPKCERHHKKMEGLCGKRAQFREKMNPYPARTAKLGADVIAELSDGSWLR
jgi:hypothetical protein